MKIVKDFQPKIVFFIAVKNRCMLYGRVFVMKWLDLKYSFNFVNSISSLHQHTFVSQASIVSEKFSVFTFSYSKA